MKRFVTGTAAGVLALGILTAGCEADSSPSTVVKGPSLDPAVKQQIDSSCEFYNNILEYVDDEHFNGKTTVPQSEIAAAAMQSMLKNAYWKTGLDPVNGEMDKSLVNIVKDEQSEKETIQSLKVGTETVTYAEPHTAMKNYVDHCAYLQPAVVAIAEQTDISIKRLFEYAVEGALHSAFDPHTSYAFAEESDNFQISMNGEFGGLGIVVGMEDGVVKVQEPPMEGTPAEANGLMANDLIIKLDGETVRGKTLNEAVSLMRGKVGTDITLTVQRGDAEPFDLKVTRDKIIVHAVKGELIGENNDSVYFKVKTFSRRTLDDFIDEANRLRKLAAENGNQIKNIIVDFRGNGGGLLPQAKAISDILIDAKKSDKVPLVAIGKTHEDDVTYAERVVRGNLKSFFPGAEVKVLQNGGSASASEIVAGATKDFGISVYGTRSFGKGSVQTVLPVNDEGKGTRTESEIAGTLKVTVAAFFPGKSGLSNQGSGVIPTTQVVYNDTRDDIETKRTREAGLEKALISAERTRAGNTPQFTCSLKAEFAGPLSEDKAAAIPAYIVREVNILNEEEKKLEKQKFVDADLDCAMDGQYTETTPYAAPKPGV
ncbi:MAG: S41 family peptidase [Rhodospirillales bacterium]|nr:S41 family peptidase [Rhodospirillales bacterium]MCB9996229.1 S41 family peptidase [Rhodospirillales bacterium]